MRIIHICQRDDAATGGAVRVAFELVKSLIQAKVDVRLLFLYGSQGYFGNSLPGGCDYLGLRNSQDVWLYPLFNQYIAEKKPDIIHHHENLLWTQLLTLRHPNYKKVVHAHSLGKAKAHQTLKLKLLYACQRKSADLVVAITKETQKSNCINVGFSEEIVHVIPNGIDLHHYTPVDRSKKLEARQRFNLPLDVPIVGFVGRLNNSMKGVDDFIKVVHKLPSHWLGLIVGEGPDLLKLKEFSQQLGIEKRIWFTGLLNEPELAYKAMDVFAFTSRFEPFGLTIAEAMASGIPVVGFSCPGGANEILTSETGVVITERNIENMAQAIVSTLAHPEKYLAHLQQAHQLLKTKFSWENSVAKTMNLYTQLYQD